MAKISINLDSLKPKREWKRHKIAQGHNTYRILPPFGDSSNGYPYRKWSVSWLSDVETGRRRPFASCLMEEKRCPLFEYVELLSAKAEDMKANMKASGASDEDIKERLKPINGVISNVRPKTIYAYNAINKAGEVGLLEVKATAQKVLKELMMQYIQDYNQDPTSLNSLDDDSGVWFDFTRQGEGFKTEYDVKKVQHKVKDPRTGVPNFQDDRSPLPENVVENYENLAYDLSTIYQVKSYDELKAALMANLKTIINEVPEAAVPGFDDFSNVADIAVNDDGGGNEEEQETKTAPAKSTGKSKVNLKLDSDDEAELTTVNTVTSNNTQDIFALANSFLEN